MVTFFKLHNLFSSNQPRDNYLFTGNNYETKRYIVSGSLSKELIINNHSKCIPCESSKCIKVPLFPACHTTKVLLSQFSQKHKIKQLRDKDFIIKLSHKGRVNKFNFFAYK